MIQKGSFINVIDNSGAKEVACIHVVGGYRKRYAYLGDIIIVSIKSMRTKRKTISKIKKGDIVKALIVKTKKRTQFFNSESVSFSENAVVLISLQDKFIGTRIFGSILKSFRYTPYIKLLSLSSGIIN